MCFERADIPPQDSVCGAIDRKKRFKPNYSLIHTGCSRNTLYRNYGDWGVDSGSGPPLSCTVKNNVIANFLFVI